jgi:hypothetical protein
MLLSRLDSYAPLRFPHSSERTYARGFTSRWHSGTSSANVTILSACQGVTDRCQRGRHRGVADPILLACSAPRIMDRFQSYIVLHFAELSSPRY